jgi:hypothetical protein
MPDLVIQDIDPDVYERMRAAAKAKGTTLVQVARRVLEERFAPPKDNAWAEAERLRKKIGKVSGASTKMIRDDRDNHEPYR